LSNTGTSNTGKWTNHRGIINHKADKPNVLVTNKKTKGIISKKGSTIHNVGKHSDAEKGF
jgi:hypothetical protein